jgi:hypothetical protein
MWLLRITSCCALLGSLSAQDARRPQLASVPWSSLGSNPQHTALSPAHAQSLGRIRWQTPVDLAPQYDDEGELLIHYGSPLVTSRNTVIVPVKTGATGGLRVDARDGATGTLKWTATTDYVFPPSTWTPEFAPAMTPNAKPRLYYPGAGGTVYFRDDPDSDHGATGQVAFYGLNQYAANRQAYDSTVIINTPLTVDPAGNVYFGFLVTGENPSSLVSGIARISASGQGTWISAAAAANNQSIQMVVYNCAPALNAQTGTLYIAVSTGYSGSGYLLALNSTSLATLGRAELKDPATGLDATLLGDGSASPTVGPDGDVYYGVLESSSENHFRGWLLHFDSTLSLSKIPGSFGWDDTPSIVPSSMVPSYNGTSSYLLMTKYNDYIEAGGTGINRLAVLDPNAQATDSITGTLTMKEVLTVAGVTPDGTLPAVKEWCINSAAVDPSTNSVLAGSEDGKLYRWNLVTNTLSQSIVLTPGIGEAYTPTLIGPDGTVYAINNATLYAVGN